MAPPVLLVAAWLVMGQGSEFQAANAGMFLALTAAIPVIGLMVLGGVLVAAAGILAWMRKGEKPAK